MQAPAAGAARARRASSTASGSSNTKNYVAAILNGDETNFFGAAVADDAHGEDAHGASPRRRGRGDHGRAAREPAGRDGDSARRGRVVSAGKSSGPARSGERDEATFSFSAPNVVEGDDQVTLVSHGAADSSVLESLELSYPHTYAADGDALLLTAPAATRVAITGFSAPSVRVVDVTDATPPDRAGRDADGGGRRRHGARRHARGDGTAHALRLLGRERRHACFGRRPTSASSWAASHDGELVILSHASFMTALAPLVARRAQEGWTVQLVDLQDVYDEFGAATRRSSRSATSCRARASTGACRRASCCSSATRRFDPRNFLGLGDFDFAPTKLIDTSEMETASDDWFVDADLDGVPEIAIGRLPVRTKDEATAVVRRRSPTPASPICRAAGSSSRTRTTPTSTSRRRARCRRPRSPTSCPSIGSSAASRAPRLRRCSRSSNAGPFLVNYFGHGSVEIWDNLLTSAQAADAHEQPRARSTSS